MKILGIDTGKRGGFVIIDESGKVIDKLIMPVIDKEYDVTTILSFLEDHKDVDFAVIEKIHAMFQVPAKTTFEMGKGYGIVLGLLYNFKIKFYEVTPKQWQKKIHVNCLASRAKDKSYYIFNREFPELAETFKISPKGNKTLKPHDGLIDALLIAEYGRRVLK